jgi:hypothetical protein
MRLSYMRRNAHIRLFVIATLVWAGFWAAGLPAYYQQYSTSAMLRFEAILFVALTGLAYIILKRVSPRRRVNRALWIAFYFTVPLAVYDWLYCGVHLGHGIAFLWRYWYLTTYYVIPWLLLPGMAALLNGRRKAEAANGERP